MFISWVRDHIHTMKAYKYWEEDMGSYLEFFMGRQRENGMYFDYWESYRNRPVGQLYFTNCFDRQFYFVDVENLNWFFRMPIEADLEYLMVEGVYTNWQASGDRAYLEQWLPVLEKGMKYEMTDPLRWSSEHLLVKRPYSIDTWDFSSAPEGMEGEARLIYHIGNDENTPKGIMFGDNSGMFSACMQLSEMYAALEKQDKSKIWGLQGELFRQRLNSICWNGEYYAHFIPEDPVPAHIDMDPIHDLTLSNTYTINRKACTPGMAASIIEKYREVEEETSESSVAGWYGIYPPVEPHFGKYKAGVYVNGAVLPLVGGELAKAAFQNGYEKFAVEQLKKLDRILSLNERRLPGCVNTDGTEQEEAIPNEWGQAAFVSALVEGLAGIVDKSILFREVEISPRWYFTEVEETSVSVGYAEEGRQVQYDYSFDDQENRVEIKTRGKFDRFTLRIPFADNTSTAVAELNGSIVPVQNEWVNQSQYAVITGTGPENHVIVQFR